MQIVVLATVSAQILPNENFEKYVMYGCFMGKLVSKFVHTYSLHTFKIVHHL